MNIIIDRASPIPIYLQIKQQIRDRIVTGLLPPGYRLPPERKLAERLDVNRSTVLNAYHELKAAGLVESFVGRGTIVLDTEETDEGAGEVTDSASAPAPLYWKPMLTAKAAAESSSLIRDLLALPKRQDAVSFGVGVPLPEPELLEELQQIASRLFTEDGGEVMLHSPVEGRASLRQALCDRMRDRGIRCSKEEVIVLSGAQQGLDLIARTLLSPGDCVLAEEPTYFSALQTFRAAGATVIGVPVDEDGRLRLDAMESLLRSYRPKFIYVIPSYQNPSGRLMDASVRESLLHLAYRYRTPIVEEDPYGELAYGEKSPLPIKAMDEHSHVLYIGTFSKLLGPGMRIGWIAAPKPILKVMGRMKQLNDLHTNSVAQKLLDAALREGAVDRHLARIRTLYRARRDEMCAALKRYAIPGMQWDVPMGGLFLWLRLPGGVNVQELAVRAADRGVDYIPGAPFFAEQPKGSYIRLNFARADIERIGEGIRRLCAAVEDAMEGPEVTGEREQEGTIPIV